MVDSGHCSPHSPGSPGNLPEALAAPLGLLPPGPGQGCGLPASSCLEKSLEGAGCSPRHPPQLLLLIGPSPPSPSSAHPHICAHVTWPRQGHTLDTCLLCVSVSRFFPLLGVDLGPRACWQVLYCLCEPFA